MTLTPYDAGMRAAAAGRPAIDCPYRDGTDAAKDWHNGHATVCDLSRSLANDRQRQDNYDRARVTYDLTPPALIPRPWAAPDLPRRTMAK